MNFIIENWTIIVAAVAVGAVGGVLVFRFVRLPADEQLEKVREWLLFAVTEAEKELGGGTGKLKLRWVYDRFVTRFPWIAKLLGFDAFGGMVDEALVEMKEMLASNRAAQTYVKGGGCDE